MTLTFLCLVLSVTPPPPAPSSVGIELRSSGVTKGTVRVLNCTGGATCSADGGVGTLAVSASVSDAGPSAPLSAQYWTGAADSTLTAEKNLGALSTALVLNTAGTPSAYSGASCTNQFPRSLNASGAATCASVSLTADVTGTLPEANGGTGATALTCSSGQCLTSNGSAYSCTSSITANDLSCSGCVTLTSEVAGVLPVSNGGTGSAPASDDQVLVSDSSSAATWRSVPNCTDTSGNHLNYATATNGWSCGTSQLHDVGGASPQVQYNNSGVFGGIANTETDGTRLRVIAETSHPTAPASGKALHYDFAPAASFPLTPHTIDGFMGIPIPTGLLGAFLTFQSTGMNWTVGCAMPEGWGQSTIVSYNWPASFQAMGSAGTGAAWSNASLAGRSKALRFTGTAAQNAQNGIKMQTARQNAWRGNTAGAGGFVLWTRFAITTVFATSRSAVGLMGATTTPANNADFDNIADTVYVGCKSGESTLRICSNDNSGSATCSDLGASYPCTTNGAFYDVVIAAAPNSSTISYRIERLDSAAATSGTLSSDLPRNSIQLNWMDWLNSADGGSATVMDWMGTCMAANL